MLPHICQVLILQNLKTALLKLLKKGWVLNRHLRTLPFVCQVYLSPNLGNRFSGIECRILDTFDIYNAYSRPMTVPTTDVWVLREPRYSEGGIAIPDGIDFIVPPQCTGQLFLVPVMLSADFSAVHLSHCISMVSPPR